MAMTTSSTSPYMQDSCLQSFTEAQKQTLSELGIYDPNATYRFIDEKTAKVALALFELFKARDLHLTYDKSKSTLIAYDSTSFDIDAIVQDFFQTTTHTALKEASPCFFIKNQTICGTLCNFLENPAKVQTL